ncbi:SRPBCC family protein [Streptomyces mobaraensis NBRC 13819 = DSM 40847]|uniref:Polyketide cyclase/dehydrase n=1 Tax=Streptomyces mobaraensis (strain ATCC 29032 / DSM 40847 / JCM 4168 / NBRC 13819 / NCIMB 11159 / IPCR 16-22) TaxID=1223523 RepID=M3BDF3_STRM1|nr:SRPBCC family protein [Streptomyces mobaraensis]EME97619.1 hypothetical protein H340_25557 [Streptomyces mobaraensis NBRC 13819 = DSM 40847]QTT72580.1 SRPBCC family protein [Streptomyces mobaraensis NBRC 13819 = DSM 40847]
MAHRWYPILEAGDSFLASAPMRHTRTVDLPFPPEETWAVLTGDEASSWTRGMEKLTWTSERPFGVGTTREIHMSGNFVLKERFYRWDDGKRKTFTGTAASRPIFRRLVEDYVVEPTPHGSRLRWLWAAELRAPWDLPLVRHGLDRFLFAPTGRSHIDGLRAYMTTRR